MKYLSVFSRALCVALIGVFQHTTAFMINQNDPYPQYSSEYPLSFLGIGYKENNKGRSATVEEETCHFSFAPFGQRALSAVNNQKNSLPSSSSGTPNLGDLRGRWSMIGLLYGSIPQGETQPALLTAAAAQTYQDGQRLNNLNYKDINNQLGFFSVPLTYKKVGIRCEGQFRFARVFVLGVQAGFADIKQTTSPFQDQSSSAGPVSNIYGNTGNITDLKPDIGTVQQFLTDLPVAQQIFDQLGYNTRNFNKSGVEDLFVSLTWRDHIFFNTGKDKKKEWSSFCIMPFITLKGSFGVGDKKKTADLFGLPFGNNGHHSVQLSGGLSFDFTETLEMSTHFGGTHYFKRKITDMYVPTSKGQRGIFPYTADVNYEPGKSWFFTVGCNSHHFLDKLSMYAEYYFIQHEKDSITVINNDPAFVPSVLEDLTVFTVQGLNLGATYDLSENVCLGAVWQFPVNLRNAYETNTITANLLITL